MMLTMPRVVLISLIGMSVLPCYSMEQTERDLGPVKSLLDTLGFSKKESVLVFGPNKTINSLVRHLGKQKGLHRVVPLTAKKGNRVTQLDETSKFDTIICFSLFSCNRQREILENIFRTIRPGGRLIVGIGVNGIHDGPITYRQDEESILEMLDEIGFTIEQHKSSNSQQRPYLDIIATKAIKQVTLLKRKG